MAYINKRKLNFTYRIEYIVFCITLFFYTLFGIFHISSGGGPCNAVLEIFLLVPAFLFCTILLYSSYNIFFNSFQNTATKEMAVLPCVFSFILWPLCLWKLVDEPALQTILFLGPFEILIGLTFLVIVTAKSN